MSRRRTAGNPVLMVVVVVLTIIAVIAPVALLIGCAYYRYKLKGVTKLLTNSISDFWLDDDEKRSFQETNKKLIFAEKNIAKATDKGNKAGISLNVDGSFSARSTTGKEVRAVIEQNQPLVEQFSDQLDDMATEPVNRWKEFNVYAQRYFACLWGFNCWTISFIATTVAGLIKDKPLNDALAQGVYVAAAVGIVSFGICYLAGNKKGNTYTPEPPVVSLENINSY